MTKVTNATKAAILAAVTAIIQILFTEGVIGASTDKKVTLVVSILGGFIAWFTRKLSPKWNAVVTTVAKDVTSVAPVAEAVTKAVEPKPKTSTSKSKATKPAAKT